jgi:hypothetical protein
MAQGKKDEAFGSEVSSKCAHRRIMPPDSRDDCVQQLRSDAQIGYGQAGGSASAAGLGSGQGVGIGPGGGQGNGIGPGSGGGQGRGGRR